MCDGSQIGGCVQIATIRLLHNYRQGLAILARELIKEHALSAVGLLQQAPLSQSVDNAGKGIVVSTFGHHISGSESGAQALIENLAVL